MEVDSVKIRLFVIFPKRRHTLKVDFVHFSLSNRRFTTVLEIQTAPIPTERQKEKPLYPVHSDVHY